MTRDELLARIDAKSCLDFVSMMARHKSYSETEGERVLANFMAQEMKKLGLETELTT